MQDYQLGYNEDLEESIFDTPSDPMRIMPQLYPLSYDELFGKLRDKEITLLQVISTNPSWVAGYAFLSHLLEMRGKVSAAIYCMGKAYKYEPSRYAYCVALAKLLRKKYGDERSSVVYEDYLVRHPYHLGASHAYSHLLINSGKCTEAIDVYKKTVDFRTNLLETHLAFARMLRACGRLTEAVTEYKSAIKIAPDNTGIYYSLGELMMETGDYAGAIEQFQSAISTAEPDHKGLYYFDLGLAYEEVAELRLAIAAYKESIYYYRGDTYEDTD